MRWSIESHDWLVERQVFPTSHIINILFHRVLLIDTHRIMKDENGNEMIKLDRSKLFLQLNQTTTSDRINNIIQCQPARSSTTNVLLSKSHSMNMKMSQLSLMSMVSNNSTNGHKKRKLFRYNWSIRSKRQQPPPPAQSTASIHSPLPCLRRLWNIDHLSK